MLRSHTKKLKHIIVKKQDLITIWALLQKYYASDNAAAQARPPGQYYDTPTPPTISVTSSGGMTTEDDKTAIFDNDVIDLRKTTELKLRYSTRFPAAKTIQINLQEISSIFSNSLSVSGDDRIAVDGIFRELENALEAVTPRSRLLRWSLPFICVLTSASIGVSVGLLIPRLMPTPPSDPIWFRFLILSVLASAAVIPFFLFSTDKLLPTIEFDFGPERYKRAKIIRTAIAFVVVIIVLPFSIALFQRFVLGWR